ncbi:MAG TPA: right-handed parallel beta-helix repeat-containing protein [Methylomirabilota bacterium]|nr:right-handed parallel beta-helix repeat-containing protein [Methylomirabilota bacterium]
MKLPVVPTLLPLFLLTLVPAWRAAGQGSLVPPGAPSPMFKTLQQIEPRTPIGSLPYIITQPGSYYLTTNLTGTFGQHGITVIADDVTLDLGGFSLQGGGSGLSGIVVTGFRRNLRLRNGTISDWTGMGVAAFGAVDSSFEGLHLQRNTGTGLDAGSNSVIRACTAVENGAGIAAWRGSVITDCVARGNRGNGLVANAGSSIQRCLASQNGDTGIRLAAGGLVTDCVSHANGTNGVTASQSVISRCSISQNGGVGIEAGLASHVSGCVIQGNRGDGLRIDSGAVVTDNVCSGNGTSTAHAAIHAAGTANRIEGNNVVFNTTARGIRAPEAGNVVIRNTASQNNGNYDVPANAFLGIIVGSPDALNTASNALSNVSY